MPNAAIRGQYEGYRNEEGQVVSTEVPYDPVQFSANEVTGGPSSETMIGERKTLRWLINNGSQIVGPLAEREIALRLFAQELDFDCECWVEGTGKSAQIAKAGIFSGSEDVGANLWVYDGEIIHGPISTGFLKTAVICGAISENSWVCEISTVSGWKILLSWNSSIARPKPVPEEPSKPAMHLISTADAEQAHSAAKIGPAFPAGPLSAPMRDLPATRPPVSVSKDSDSKNAPKSAKPPKVA